MIALFAGTVGLALGLLVVGVLMLRVVQRVLPHDPPPLEDGESIASRIRGLRWDK